MTASDGIRIEPVHSVAEATAIVEAFREIWPGGRSPVNVDLLIALAHTGNYVVSLHVDGEVVGGSVAFFWAPEERAMHSHITGILPAARGRGLGRALKQHQRAWALERGVGAITWTYDPLIARNAHFNLAVLGARAISYHVDYYGPMADDVNRGDESDRILVSWSTAAAPAPAPAPDRVVAAVPVPDDIEDMRRTAPADAAAWRTRVREELLAHLADGLEIGGFDDTRGYLLVPRGANA